MLRKGSWRLVKAYWLKFRKKLKISPFCKLLTLGRNTAKNLALLIISLFRRPPSKDYLLAYRVILLVIFILSGLFSGLLMAGLLGPGSVLRSSSTVDFSFELAGWKPVVKDARLGSAAGSPEQVVNFPPIFVSGEVQIEAPQGFFQETPVSVTLCQLSPLELRLPAEAKDMSQCQVPIYLRLNFLAKADVAPGAYVRPVAARVFVGNYSFGRPPFIQAFTRL